uniref:uncharacterized protein LOC127065257 n=1 Tax=Vespula vulgaris TaxID=7454 RepID=UPI00223C1239|nr:uncharacterized protein LOC127065257 [Vespula vulgaris]
MEIFVDRNEGNVVDHSNFCYVHEKYINILFPGLSRSESGNLEINIFDLQFDLRSLVTSNVNKNKPLIDFDGLSDQFSFVLRQVNIEGLSRCFCYKYQPRLKNIIVIVREAMMKSSVSIAKIKIQNSRSRSSVCSSAFRDLNNK